MTTPFVRHFVFPVAAVLAGGCSLLTSLSGLSGGADGTLGEGGLDGPTSTAEGGSEGGPTEDGSANGGPRLYVFGGMAGAVNVATVLMADVRADGTLGAWQPGPSLPETRTYLQATTGIGFVALAGGSTGAGESTATLIARAEDGGLGPWATLGQFGVPRIRHGIALENGRLYVIGGTNNGGDAIGDVQFAPISATSVGPWAATSSLPATRSRTAVASTPTAVYVFGGTDTGSTPVASVYRATIEADGRLGAFAVQPSLPGGRTHAQATRFGSHIVVTGGEHFADVSVFDIDANTGSLGAPRATLILPAVTDHHAAARWQSHLYIVGGYRAGKLSSEVLVGDVDGDGNVTKWTATTPLPQPLGYHTAVIY
jgi:hypothetical protein